METRNRVIFHQSHVTYRGANHVSINKITFIQAGGLHGDANSLRFFSRFKASSIIGI